jgi:hypothetical protein
MGPQLDVSAPRYVAGQDPKLGRILMEAEGLNELPNPRTNLPYVLIETGLEIPQIPIEEPLDLRFRHRQAFLAEKLAD